MANLLLPLSWLYAVGVTLRNRAFERGLLEVLHLGVPVISVGNIEVGGVGKTPLVEYIAAHCRRKGKRVGIVSRGYKRKTKGVVVVSDGRSLLTDACGGGDEPIQIARKMKDAVIVVGERRVDAARVAMELGAEVVILDDGFQHRYLHRNLDIVVLDSTRDVTREHLLPAGRMRETLRSVLRAHLIALSHVQSPTDEPLWIESLKRPFLGKIVKCRHRPSSLRRGRDDTMVSILELPSHDVLAFSGIDKHERFVACVKELGLTVSDSVQFPDHHSYNEKDFQMLGARMGKRGVRACVTTEKDIARMIKGPENGMQFLRERDVYYLPVVMEVVEGEPTLIQMIDDCLERRAML